MVIILDTPYSLGDLSQETFPHVYITQTHINGPANTVTVEYEVGTMGQGNVWSSAPFPTSKMIVMQGRELAPFVMTKPKELEVSLWEQVSRVIYEEVQNKDSRLKGQLGAGFTDSKPETPSTTTEPEAEPTPTPDDKAASDTTTEPTSETPSESDKPSETEPMPQSEPSGDSSASEPEAEVAQPEASPSADEAPKAESEQNVEAPTEEAPATTNEASSPDTSNAG